MFSNVLYVADEPDLANVDLLQARFDETAAGIDIVVGELLLHLGKAESVSNQLVRIDAHLIFAGRATEAGNIDNVGHRLEVFLDDPIFQRFQFHHVVCGIRAVQRVEINLADGAPVGTHLRSDARR